MLVFLVWFSPHHRFTILDKYMFRKWSTNIVENKVKGEILMPLFPINCSRIIHGGQRLFFNFLGHSRRPYWTEACHRIFNLVCVCITEIPSVRSSRIWISILMQKDSVSSTHMHAFCRVILNTLFGLSTTYWMAITTRLVLGALNGLLAPIKVLLNYQFQ